MYLYMQFADRKSFKDAMHIMSETELVSNHSCALSSSQTEHIL